MTEVNSSALKIGTQEINAVVEKSKSKMVG
jgi:hypothetical protein